MSPSLQSRAPLARSTLLHMGVRIAVIIALTTFFSYLHMFQTLREEARAQLEQHVSERGQREQAIFVLAEDNHAVLKTALAERIRALSPQEVSERFDRLFVHLPDGTVRNRPEGFDGTKMVGLFVPQGVELDAELRRRILASYDVLTQYGPAFHTRFTDTYITLPEGPNLLYWPESPTYSQDAQPDFSLTELAYFPISTPQNNPERKTAWSEAYFDPPSQLSITSVVTPLDLDGRHVATLAHDVVLGDMVTRTHQDRLPGTYNIIFRDDGQLIAHPEMPATGDAGVYNILGTVKQSDGVPAPLGSEQLRAHLRAIFERVRKAPPGERVLELPEHGEYLATTRLQGPGWTFVTVLPESVVTKPALQAARYVLLLGLLSLVLELVIMAWVLRHQVTRPLVDFAQATDRVASGDFHVELDTSRHDELGQLARAFRLMADEVQRREQALREANESLEQRVEERTRELKDVHMQLVQTARRAGMAEIATNVLHNVGNVLNSVYTSAQLARERMAGMRLEQVGRVAQMIEEHQPDVGTFLTQDERGRKVMPFLNKLGQNLLEERKDIVTLLDDVGRYTEHVGDIVKVQQNYARLPRVHEPVQLADLVEDALRINSAGLIRHQVKVQRQLAPLPPVLTDKHKTLMILVNLVSNAKYAMDGVPVAERLLTVKMERTPSGPVHLQVHDNGMGIAPEMLTRIFQYGFTTRDEGHGFGLHSSAVAAQEMGGSLTVHSEGPGHGATFTLELPSLPGAEEETTRFPLPRPSNG
ncbi:histidine kinase/DNA gyrase B/HSP90-like ATPase [Archangium gephyra]|uniref:histidine kinase n=1 Tax=Archangium gephyra TaxID=48 RepID=A0AAC8QEH3_9BACT|nr:ATP-binding protein [Archangium gephyra]AKJ06247.1 sensor histidine kinase [Archangium gephyra]REG27004.1 histidine kinase/DNA gyrase B/HSP90-like ATPase [Archangium gephyra]